MLGSANVHRTKWMGPRSNVKSYSTEYGVRHLFYLPGNATAIETMVPLFEKIQWGYEVSNLMSFRKIWCAFYYNFTTSMLVCFKLKRQRLKFIVGYNF